MTNNEILKADMLDILFENRNKSYGAYALRRGYDQRMLKAMGIVGIVVLVFILLSAFTGKRNANAGTDKKSDPDVKVINLPPKEPEQPKKPEVPKQKPEKQIKYTNEIKVVPDDKKTDSFPSIKDIENGNVGSTDEDGEDPGNIFKKPEDDGNGNGTSKDDEKKKDDDDNNKFEPKETQASFPGGIAAFRDFLSRHLHTPSDLEPGEKKVVIVKFKVGIDGKLSDIVVIESAGEDYTKEVIRVLKKMPAWEPATQNGIKVPVYFTQPVTFIGQEE